MLRNILGAACWRVFAAKRGGTGMRSVLSGMVVLIMRTRPYAVGLIVGASMFGLASTAQASLMFEYNISFSGAFDPGTTAGGTFTVDGTPSSGASYTESDVESFTFDWGGGEGISAFSLAFPAATNFLELFSFDPTINTGLFFQTEFGVTPPDPPPPYNVILQLAGGGEGEFFLGFGDETDRTDPSASVVVSAVPLPPAILLFVSGLIGLVGIGSRRRRKEQDLIAA